MIKNTLIITFVLFIISGCVAPNTSGSEAGAYYEENRSDTSYNREIETNNDNDNYEEYFQEKETNEKTCEMFGIKANSQPMFSLDDILLFDISLGDSKDEVVKAIGKPDSIVLTFSEAFMAYDMRLNFRGFGSVYMIPEMVGGDCFYWIAAFTITDESVAGPRNTRVGDHYLDVISRFYVNSNQTGEKLRTGEKLLYKDEQVSGVQGIVRYDDDDNIFNIIYYCYDEYMYFLLYLVEPLDNTVNEIRFGYVHTH